MTLLPNPECFNCTGNFMNRQYKYNTELIEMVIKNLQHIEEVAKRITPESLSYDRDVMIGIAKRTADYLDKKINS